MFFPKYEEISKDESVERFEFFKVVKWFYTTDNYFYVLNVYFLDSSSYEIKKQELLQQHYTESQKYVDRGRVVSRTIGNYECYIGGNNEALYQNVDYGMYYGMYCFNDTEKTIRYAYYYNGRDMDFDIDVVPFESFFDWE